MKMKFRMRRTRRMPQRSSRTFDWEQVHTRIEAIRQSLARQSLAHSDADAVSPEMLRQVWAQRAQRLAQTDATEELGDTLELVVVRLGRELYGLDAAYVFRIRPAGQITFVPRAPAWVAGVANERGRILSVCDLRRFLDLEAPEGGEAQRYLVVVETPEMELALLADEVLDVKVVPRSDIREAHDTVRGIPQDYVRGLMEYAAADLDRDHRTTVTVVVLDLRTLLSDERLRVRQELT